MTRDRDGFAWLLCTNRQTHELDKLMLTQIIAGDSMMAVSRALHEMRSLMGIEQKCDCPLAREVPNGYFKVCILTSVWYQFLDLGRISFASPVEG